MIDVGYPKNLNIKFTGSAIHVLKRGIVEFFTDIGWDIRHAFIKINGIAKVLSITKYKLISADISAEHNISNRMFSHNSNFIYDVSN